MKLKNFIKRFKNKVISFLLTSSICVVSAVCPFIPASADSPNSIVGTLVDSAYSSWADVPEAGKELAQAYVDLFKSTDLKGVLKSIEDIPISWLKMVGTSQYALSPFPTVAYILNENGVLEVENTTSSSHGGRHRVGTENDDVVVDSEIFKQGIKKANKYYSPKNCRQYISFRTSDYSPRIILYSSGIYPNCFFEQGWRDGCYYTPFYYDGTDYYYSPYVYHDYLKLNDEGVTEYHSDVEDMRDPSRGIDARVFTSIYLKSGSYVVIRPFTTHLSCYSVYANFDSFMKEAGFSLSSGATFGSGSNTYTYYLDGKMSSPITCTAHYDFAKFTPEDFDQRHSDLVNCDVGFFISSEPIEYSYTFDTEKIPDNYYITVSGDTIYDYSITNPETGQSSTINEYITNNYTYITNNNTGGDGSGSSGTVGGDVNVGGNVGVNGNVNVGGEVKFGGEVNVNVSPIDVNVNVSGAGESGEKPPSYIEDMDVDLDSYIEQFPEVSKGFFDYLKGFFDWLPKEIYGLIIMALVVAVWCRLAGR